MKPPAPKLVFVYGTLKRRCSNHRYLASQTFVGEARTVAGYRLFDLGDYPGMVAASDDREGVTGEIWSVDAAGLARLDKLEGVAEGLYRRGSIALLAPFVGRAVDTYLYALSVTDRRALGPTWSE